MSTTSLHAKAPSAKLHTTCCLAMAAAVVALSTREISHRLPQQLGRPRREKGSPGWREWK